ncbi:Glyoxalase/Bleomycin resistance protein/Dihydroxybiphenyl dioxygenase [Mycena polygramma]|nr:Glyoxalase/Bleomycin resistance protein/Dihydroxybiphenyl dioxygenase [Mycena polygramma]
MAAAHPRPLGHVSLGVRDYEVSKAFYTPVLATIGLELVYDSEVPNPSRGTRMLSYGRNEDEAPLDIFEFANAAPPGEGFHLAFNAPTRESVVEFHAKGLEFGGKDNGPPGLRRHYGDNYFAAFIIDPDGWRLEVVCKKTEGTVHERQELVDEEGTGGG